MRAPVVCAVNSPGGTGCGVLFTLRGAPVVLIPFHVLGCLENASATSVVAQLPTAPLTSAAAAAAASAAAQVEVTAAGQAGSGTLVEFELCPRSLLMHSPCPLPGCRPDASHLDYALVACRPAPTTGPPAVPAVAPDTLVRLLELPRLEDALPAAKRAAMAVAAAAETGDPAAEVLLCAAPKRWLRLASEAKRPASAAVNPTLPATASFVPSATIIPLAITTAITAPTASAPASPPALTSASPSGLEWRRGRVTSTPHAPKWAVVRYDVSTEFGSSGAAVMMSVTTTEASSGGMTFVLAAMHRAGAAGSDGEGITIYDIFRDVAESVAEGAIRRASRAGDLSPAVAQLTRLAQPRPEVDLEGGGGDDSRGGRCRAAAAAARAVAERSSEAAHSMAKLSTSPGAAGKAEVATTHQAWTLNPTP